MLQKELHNYIIEAGVDIEHLTFSDVMNGFPRLRSLVIEVLRMKGPVPFLCFEPIEPIKFQGKIIQPGTVVCTMTRSCGKQAASEVPIGPNKEGAEQFCPQRWLDLKTGGLAMQPSNKYGGYMPFGHGARVCPGSHLAMAESVNALFCILQQFEVVPVENHPPVQRVVRLTDTYDGEIQLTLKARS